MRPTCRPVVTASAVSSPLGSAHRQQLLHGQPLDDRPGVGQAAGRDPGGHLVPRGRPRSASCSGAQPAGAAAGHEFSAAEENLTPSNDRPRRGRPPPGPACRRRRSTCCCTQSREPVTTTPTQHQQRPARTPARRRHRGAVRRRPGRGMPSSAPSSDSSASGRLQPVLQGVLGRGESGCGRHAPRGSAAAAPAASPGSVVGRSGRWPPGPCARRPGGMPAGRSAGVHDVGDDHRDVVRAAADQRQFDQHVGHPPGIRAGQGVGDGLGATPPRTIRRCRSEIGRRPSLALDQARVRARCRSARAAAGSAAGDGPPRPR